MSKRMRLVKACAIGTFLSGTALISTGTLAQTASTATSGFAQADPVEFWWFHGSVEAGGRFFVNNPQRNGSSYLGQSSLAKYYEYSTVKPGPFSDIWLSTGSKDGLYQIDIGGNNIGYTDQAYYLDVSKAGQFYLNFGWDQTPHVYSTSAQTPYSGVGTNNLTVTPAATPSGLSYHQTDIGIRRDTASTDARWTPTDAWDIKADYSHMARTGTQVDGVIFLGASTNGVEVPKPVDDKTQNYGLNGEYAGNSPWGEKLTVKLGYTGSQYTDNYSSYTIQNPGTAGTHLNARLSLPPSNNANGLNGTVAVGLPWLKSRYVGTVSYTMMRQDDAFIPFSLNQIPATALPAASLNGAINTTLINNIITSQLTSDLKSKISYRYYNFQNNTPQLFFPIWPNRDNTTTTAEPIQSVSISYTKQNAGAQLNWRPVHAWNWTAEYGYERYDYKNVDADATNENSAKLSADWKPLNWLTARSSAYYSNRRYENYDYRAFAYNNQFPTGAPDEWYYANSYRQLMYSNRQRTKVNFAVDIVAFRGLTVTPNFKYQDDNYGIDANTQQGLNDSRSLATGVDLAFVASPDLSFVLSYLFEHYDQSMYSYTATGSGGIASTQTTTSSKSNVNTFTAAMNYVAIPDKLTLDARYMASLGTDDTKVNLCCGKTFSVQAGTSFEQFPVNTTLFQRFNATATYKFDKQQVAQLGWKGDIKAKLRYTWERNTVSNWQTDALAPYGTYGNTTEIFMAYNNPNYSAQMVSASLVASW